jgi:FKBP-type peptidyl-prolyl cis-trans isomerase
LRPFFAAVLLLAAGMAGCAAPLGGVEADFITPGVWDVHGSTDYMYAWAHNGGSAAKETLVIAAARGKVSGPNSKVSVHYDGHFLATDERFQDGDFSTTLGQTPSETVPGFDNGLMGLALGETADLHLPAAFGYGFAPDASHAQFAGKDLRFIVTIKGLT